MACGAGCCTEAAGGLWRRVTRKKAVDADVLVTPLRRCLNAAELMLLGVGHMMGAGVYVTTGAVMRNTAGPAVVLSYLLAGAATLLASFGYVEFGSKVPKAGSSYSYTYLVLGEFPAFFVGWNVVLEHMITAAAVARAYSGTLDNLADGAISNGTMEHVGTLAVVHLSRYLDLLALGLVLVLVIVIATGAKSSSIVINAATAVNISLILFVCGTAFTVSDFSRLTAPECGGFAPFGVSGVLTGTATCFFAYIGFETVAIAGEEARNPDTAIPIGTFGCVCVSGVLYMLMSLALGIMVPAAEVDVLAPYPAAFQLNGVAWARYLVAVGSLLGLTASLLGGLYSLPRAVYAMAADGLIFKQFGEVSETTQVPVLAAVVFGTLTGVLAMLFDLATLVELLSIGTLICLTMVSISVLVLRYLPADQCPFRLRQATDETDEPIDVDDVDNEKKTLKQKYLQQPENIGRLKPIFRDIPVISKAQPGRAPFYAIMVLVFCLFCSTLLLVKGWYYVANIQIWAILLLVLFVMFALLSLAVLSMHEHNVSLEKFQTPLVPFLPTLSILVNFTMVFSLNNDTWLRLAIWVAIGLVVYFGYGIRNSKENKPALSTYTALSDYGSSGTVTQDSQQERAVTQDSQQDSQQEKDAVIKDCPN